MLSPKDADFDVSLEGLNYQRPVSRVGDSPGSLSAAYICFALKVRLSLIPGRLEPISTRVMCVLLSGQPGFCLEARVQCALLLPVEC